MKTSAPLIIAALLFGSLISARAGLTAALAPAVQNSAKGKTLVFSGTLTNTSMTNELFLNDIQFALTGSAVTHLVSGPYPFFANVPGILLPGETYTGEIFSVALNANAVVSDYAGTVTLQGGGDIFAAVNLSTTGFTVLSPAVTIAASDASASEFGPDIGTFTITRTGGTSIDLPVSFTISGTAVNGTTYQTVATSTTINAGTSSKVVTLTPIADSIAQGDRNAAFTLTSSALYNLGVGITSSVIIHDMPADAWRVQNFGAAANSPEAADTAEWDHNGIANLTAFALAIDPKSPDRSALPATSTVNDYFTLSYVPNSAATDVQFSVEGSGDLVQWSGADVESVSDPNPIPPNRVTVRYKYPITTNGHGFLRLRVTR